MNKWRKYSIFSLIAAALTLGVQGAAAENEIVYSLGENASTYGTSGKKAETYNVAIRIKDANLVGAKVKAVRIAFPFTEGLSNAKAWLSKELPAVKQQKAGDPDITSQAFEIAEGYTEVTFAEPYTLTEDGVFVGYGFSVAKSDVALQPVATTGTTAANGLFIHSTQIFRTAWHDKSSVANLAIQVVLEGDNIKADAAAIASIAEVNATMGLASEGSLVLVNQGYNGIQSIDYTVEVIGKKESKHLELAEPIPGVYSRSQQLVYEIPALLVPHTYNQVVTIDKVNGKPNSSTTPSATGVLNVYSRIPKHRSVVEEYTGTWCGYCPRGFVGLEEMNRLYPEDFIGISYHNGDPMEIMSSGSYPSYVAGFPDAWLDRAKETDAYGGDEPYGQFGIDKAWLSRADQMAPADVDITAQWDKAQETITATATANFVKAQKDHGYQLGIVLTADGLSGTSSDWSQSNYYSGATGWPENMDEFTTGSSSVSGLTFNFVIVAYDGLTGVEGSLPESIPANTDLSYTTEFKVSDIVNTAKAPVIQDNTKVNAIVLLIDTTTGEIVNANKVRVQGGAVTTSIDAAKTQQGDVVSGAYYDMQGRQVTKAGKGLYIKVETLANGQKRTTKQLLK